jgi:hypothetical protein
MPTFRVVRVQVPGAWRDGWLYKDHLLLWSRAGSLYWIPLGVLLELINRHANKALGVLCECLLFRNDWKSGEPFRKLVSVEGVLPALLRDYSYDQHEAIVKLPTAPLEEARMEPAPGLALDTQVYANRVYVASSEGLFESYFDPQHPRRSYPAAQHLDVRTAKVSARYSSLNASAEDEGLWFAPIHIGDDWFTSLQGELSMSRVAGTSLAASFASRNLLNYKDSPTPGFLRAQAEKARPHQQAIYDDWRVLRYEPEREIQRLALGALRSQSKVSLASVGEDGAVPLTETPPSVLGNSEYRLLVHWQEQLRVIDVSAYPGKDVEARPDKRFAQVQLPDASPDQVLEVYPIGAGFLVELFSEVRLLTPRASYLLFDEPAARIRTFPQSRRYRDVALIMGEDSCNLVGFLELRQHS